MRIYYRLSLIFTALLLTFNVNATIIPSSDQNLSITSADQPLMMAAVGDRGDGRRGGRGGDDNGQQADQNNNGDGDGDGDGNGDDRDRDD